MKIHDNFNAEHEEAETNNMDSSLVEYANYSIMNNHITIRKTKNHKTYYYGYWNKEEGFKVLSFLKSFDFPRWLSCNNLETTGKEYKKYIRQRMKNISTCKWCNKRYIKTHSKQKYCGSDCRTYARQEHNKEGVQRYYKRYPEKQSVVGVGNMGKSRKKDFDDELRIVESELRKYGLD